MPSEVRQKKIMKKLNRAQKCSILGPQKPRVKGGARVPGVPPLDPHLDGTCIAGKIRTKPLIIHVINVGLFCHVNEDRVK